MDVLELNIDGKFTLLGRRHELVFGWGQADRKTILPRITLGAVPAGYGATQNRAPHRPRCAPSSAPAAAGSCLIVRPTFGGTDALAE